MNKETIDHESEREADKVHFEAWKKGDPRGYSELYAKYKSRVFGFLMKMTGNRDVAEDLLQETFFAAYRNISQFDQSRSFLSWLFGIAHKRSIDYFRHAKVEQNHEEDAKSAIGSRIETPDVALGNDEIKKLVAEALETLDPAQREVFLLRELGGVPFKDIAVMMKCPLNTALGRMRLALLNIRRELEQRGIDGTV